jgi:hypothetical protein
MLIIYVGLKGNILKIIGRNNLDAETKFCGVDVRGKTRQGGVSRTKRRANPNKMR